MGIGIATYMDWVRTRRRWLEQWALWSDGAEWPVMSGREKRGMSFGIMPIGRQS